MYASEYENHSFCIQTLKHCKNLSCYTSCSVEFEPGTSVKEMVQQFMRTIDIEFDKKLGPGGIRRVTGTCYDRIVFKDDNENYKYIYTGNFYHN